MLRSPGGERDCRQEPARARPCCGDSCAWAARRTSFSAQVRHGRYASGSPPRGTGSSSSVVRFEVFAQEGGQPRVGWLAVVRERATSQLHEVSGHVEVRWSHGRFGGPPEAKGYLDTPHTWCRATFPSGDGVRPLHVRGPADRSRTPQRARGAPAVHPVGPPVDPPGGHGPLHRQRHVGAVAYNDDEGRAFIERQRDGAPWTRLLVRHRRRGEPGLGLGGLGLWLHEIGNGRASIGYWVASRPGAAPRGVGVAWVVAFAFEVLAIPRLHLFIEPWNVASLRTAVFAGFCREALLRGWERIDQTQHDAYSYVLLRQDPDEQPPPGGDDHAG